MHFLSRFIPSYVLNEIGSGRYLGWDEYFRLKLMLGRYQREYAKQCPKLEADEFFVPPSITLKIDPLARGSFDRYTVGEPQVIDEMNSFVRATRESKCLLDIGAEFGLFAMVFASRPGAVAYAIDPSPRTTPVLLRNISLNPDLKIFPEQLAVGESEGILKMLFDGIMMHAATTQAAAEEVAAFEIPVITIDNFVDQHTISPDAIKIDVEGFEFAVLKGASRTIDQYRPTIFLELHPVALAETGSSPDELVSWLRNRGYHFMSCRSSAIPDPAAWAGNTLRRFICIPK